MNRELGWNDPNWLANGHSFQVLLDRYVDDRRGLRVLEVGAAKAWAARFWLERDCEFVATDILVDPKIGLGRGAFYGDFGRVQADGENLPFADATFDVDVLRRDAAPRARPARRWCGRWRASRSRGGVVAGLNEGTRGVGRSADNPDQAGEKELGINEHVHTRLGVPRRVRAGGLRRAPDGARRRLAAACRSATSSRACRRSGMTLGTLAHLTRCARTRASRSTRASAARDEPYLRDVVRYRELLGNLFRRDLQAKYRGSALGVLWTVANPVMLMGVYLLVFGVVWKSPFATWRPLPALPAHRPRALDVLRGRGAVVDALDARQREPDPQDALPAPARAALGRRSRTSSASP